MTAAGFLLARRGGGARVRGRLSRRVEALKGRKPGAASGQAAVRSLSRRDNATKMDKVARRWLPRRDMLIARLERTGRKISIGQYAAMTIVLAAIFAMLLVTFAGLQVPASMLVGGRARVLALPHMVIGRMGKRRVAAFHRPVPGSDRPDGAGAALGSADQRSDHHGQPRNRRSRSAPNSARSKSGMRLGRDLESLLWDIGKRIDAPEFRFFIIALSVQRETGGNLAETLSNLSDVLRRRRTMRQKARAMASEARASTMILGSLPIHGDDHPVDNLAQLHHAAVRRHPRVDAGRPRPRDARDRHRHHGQNGKVRNMNTRVADFRLQDWLPYWLTVDDLIGALAALAVLAALIGVYNALRSHNPFERRFATDRAAQGIAAARGSRYHPARRGGCNRRA
jgi:tight adherence protein B